MGKDYGTSSGNWGYVGLLGLNMSSTVSGDTVVPCLE